MPQVEGQEPQPGRVNYIVGRDPSRWQTGVPTYSKVRYRDVYPGVDLLYYGNQRELEYDLVVAPGSDPSRIAFTLKGAYGLVVAPDGDLVARLGGGELRLRKPVLYQQAAGRRREVEGGYVVEGGRVRFRVGEYDRGEPLVIDPVVSYATYLGGEGYEYFESVAVDAAGSAYVFGYTSSKSFPTAHALYPTFRGGLYDLFVAKLNPAGTALVYSTYLGGSGGELSGGIAVDASGQVYLTGATTSPDFPVTPGAFQTTPGGIFDAFVTKLNASGDGLVYSTLVGGGDNDGGDAIAVDSAGDAFVTGDTGGNASGHPARNFPVTPGAFQRATVETGDSTWGDGFVLKLNPSGSALIYSTLLSGSRDDDPSDIRIDAAGDAYVVGTTQSLNYPVTPGAFQTALKMNGFMTSKDVFVTKLNPSGSAPVFSTLLGGTVDDTGNGIGLDADQNVYVAGTTSSSDFPTTPGSFQPVKGGGIGNNAFVTKLNPTGSALVYSTFLGGDGDGAAAIAVRPSGTALVTGLASSSNFPLTPDAYQQTGGGYLTEFSPSGGLAYSTRFGSPGASGGSKLVLDANGGVYVTGATNSSSFPVTAGTAQTLYGGGESDAFVVKFSGFTADPTPTPTPPPTPTPTQTPYVQFSAATVVAGEGDGHAQITVARVGDTSGVSSVDVRTLDDTHAIRCDDNTTMQGIAFARCDYATTVQ
ncbi:MAG: SBBP repeat-containing protein, partial [Acidobacteriota bacterium]|nr:SBBP repeat-containing protein [Acidobacteriota bacterium]